VSINVWLALRDDAQSLIVERLRWNEQQQGAYNGPVTDRQAKIFRYMADQENTRRLFKTATLNSRQWSLWSVYFNPAELGANVLQIVKDELDQLAADYPSRFVIAGAWRWNGTQIPGYPPHPQLLKFMPDVWNGDLPPTYSAPTVLTDVNLLMGQAPRDFS
jgi:hypothetical protein